MCCGARLLAAEVERIFDANFSFDGTTGFESKTLRAFTFQPSGKACPMRSVRNATGVVIAQPARRQERRDWLSDATAR